MLSWLFSFGKMAKLLKKCDRFYPEIKAKIWLKIKTNTKLFARRIGVLCAIIYLTSDIDSFNLTSITKLVESVESLLK